LLFPHPLYVLGGVAGWNITPEVIERVRHAVGSWEDICRLVVVFSGGRSRPGPSNASPGCPLLGWVGVVVVVVGFGVWWCVECCIVDASIFFCVWFCGLCVFVVCEVL